MKKTTSILLILIVSVLAVFVVIRAASIKTTRPKPEPKAAIKDKANRGEKPKKTVKVDENKPTEKVKTTQPGDFLPVTLNYSWEYIGEGNEYASFDRKIVAVSENLAQIREDNGGTVSQSVFRITLDDVTRIYFVGEAYGDANYLKSTPNDNAVIIKAPIKVGTKWIYKTATREIVDVSASINTPAGKFTGCLKIKISEQYSTIYEYYASGVGLVYKEFYPKEQRSPHT